MFTGPLPSWAAMALVPFAAVPPSQWDAWKSSIVGGAIGTAALIVGLLLVLKRRLMQFFVFTPSPGYEQLEVWYIRRLVLGGALIVATLVPLYYYGANQFTCGQPWLYTTVTSCSWREG